MGVLSVSFQVALLTSPMSHLSEELKLSSFAGRYDGVVAGNNIGNLAYGKVIVDLVEGFGKGLLVSV